MSATRPPSFDERYAAPVEASRRGAHRARPNAVTALLPIVAGVVVILVVVAGAWMVLGGNGGSSGPSSSVAAAPTETQPPSAAPSSSAPAPSASASVPSAEPSETGSAAGDVDWEIEVRVLNSIRVSGLAKGAADALEDKGWTIGEVTDSKQRNLEVSRVYYAEDEQEATADAIVADLGYGETRKSAANAGDGITVVLGQDANEGN